MNFNRTFIYAILVFLIGACNSDNPDWQGETIQNLSSSVNAIAIDNNNTKWIGTDQGLYRKVDDGFQLINLKVDGKINALFFDQTEKLLWIGAEGVLIKAIIADNDFVLTKVSEENLSNPNVISFYADNNSKRWMGTLKGITLNYNEIWKKEKFRVNEEGNNFSMPVENLTVNSIASSGNDYFFATSGSKLYRAYDYDNKVDAFSGATQWDYPYNGFSITDSMFVVFIDNEDRKWMGGTEGIQVHVGNDPKDMSSFTYYYDELPDRYVLAIEQAPNNDIWVGTRKGIAVFDGEKWTVIDKGIPSLYINAIEFDKDGTAWVGTKNGLANIE